MDTRLVKVSPEESKVVIGGKKVREVTVVPGTPFNHIFQLIRESGFREVRVGTYDPATGESVELYMSNPPQSFAPGRIYEVTPYDQPGL